jgi:hypothetical protein
MNKKQNDLIDRVLAFYGNEKDLDKRVRFDRGELARYARHYVYGEYGAKQKLTDALDGWKGF